MFTTKTTTLFTVTIAAATNLATAHAHSDTEMGPLLSAVHEWLHAGAGDILSMAGAIIGVAWLAGWRYRKTRHKGN